MNAAVAYVRAIADAGLAALPDGDLLARFARERDEPAFAELVRRHGRMVLGTCRRVLGGDADADDCAQAAFVVLARRAGQFAGRATVGDFLHGVAVRVALKARARAAKRRAAEQRAARPAGFVAAESPDPDALAALDRAIQSLPARLREAVVLCELEGVSRTDAAARLGVPPGTLSSRLAGARKRLAAHLTAGGFAPALAAAAAFPDTLAAAVVRSAVGPASAAVLKLVTEVTTAMTLSKLKPVLAAVMVAAALGAGAGVAQVGGGKDVKKPADPAGPASRMTQEKELRNLAGMWQGKAKGSGLEAATFVIAGDRLVVAQFPDGDQPVKPGERMPDLQVVVNPNRTPKEMTWFCSGPITQLIQVIYELDGDTLRLGYIEDEIARPRSFKSTPGETVKVAEYTRAGAKK